MPKKAEPIKPQSTHQMPPPTVAVADAPLVTSAPIPDFVPLYRPWEGPALYRMFLPAGAGWFMFDEGGRFTPMNQEQLNVLVEMRARHDAGWPAYPDIRPV